MSQDLVAVAPTDALPVTPTERLAVLEVAAEQYVRTQRPANTQRAYAADWKVWTRYVTELGIPEDSATAGALVGFVVWLERQDAAPTTVDRRLAGAVVGLRQRGAEPPKAATEAARAALNGYRRRLAEAGEKRGRGKAPAMEVKHLRAMSAACPDTLTGIRDRALALLAFAIAGRRSEVAALLVSDVVEAPEGLVVTIRSGKTGGRTVAVPHGSHESTCPVRAWRAWLAASGITEGAAFRRIDRHGRILGGLAAQSVGAVITQAGERAGVTVRFTGHSARAGLVTEARRAGHDAKTISQHTGHAPNSRVLYDYMRTVDQWADNAAAGIGL
ncbi:tyrosine-type recombinase/integrase [Saccharothrix texasensis]|uniref:tyrosine-type recombinase/integrase n=1 Tax=Saccharothrix texasensis TaxID=103734 RepID=UPI001FEADF3E|nr:tyrosine-type recombinase/integrase [Saccharothrix texasensis]